MADSSAHENRKAVALAYDAAGASSRVLAKGSGVLAESIIEEATKHGIHVHDSPELVGLLMRLDLDQVIPEQLYVVVAELLVWLLSMEELAAEE